MGVFYGPARKSIVSSGLIGYWDATKTNSYPGSGTTWTDLSGRGANGTLSGSPTFSSGEMVFDGVDDYFDSVSTTGINTGAITHCCLFNITSTPVGSRPVFGNGQTYTNGIVIGASLGSPTLSAFYRVGTTNYQSTPLTGSLNTWYFVTSCWTSGGTVKMYRNGTLHSESAIATGSIGSLLGTYTMAKQQTFYLACKISMAAVYSRELTASEINTNYLIFKDRYGL
jgi:hypothetical protein